MSFFTRKYLYSASDSKGLIKSGVITCKNKLEAEQILIQQGLIAESLKLDLAFSVSSLSEKKDFEKIINSIADLLESGLSITAALEYLVINSSNSIRKKTQSIKEGLESGQRFSEAVQNNFKFIELFYILLIESAEKTGDLLKCFKNISLIITKNNEFRSNFIASLIYPSFLLIIIGAVVGFIMSFSLPQIISQFDPSQTLPIPTKIIMGVYQYEKFFIPTVLIFLLLLLILKFMIKINIVKKIFDGIVIHSPILKKIYFFLIQRKYLQILSFSLQGGISLEESLMLTLRVSDNYYFQNYISNAHDDIANGIRFSQAVSALPFLSHEQKFIITIADESSNLTDAFTKLYQKNELSNERSLKLFNKMLEPIIIIVLGGIVMLLALGIILPSLQLSQGINVF